MPLSGIARTLVAVAQGQAQLVVPVENSIEGSVTVTLDKLHIQLALVLLIAHTLLY